MVEQTLMETIIKALTGNRIVDRNFLLDQWLKAKKESESENDELLYFIEENIDQLLPKKDKFAKDMLPKRHLWIDYLISRAMRFNETYPLEEAQKRIKMAINELEAQNPRAKKEKVNYFSVEDPFEQAVIKNTIKLPGEVIFISEPFAFAYLVMGIITFARGREDEGASYIGIANSWNPASYFILSHISMYFKRRKLADKLAMISRYSVAIARNASALGESLRMAGYSYYLHGQFERAYACYHESLRFGGYLDDANAELDAILTAMGRKAYTLKRREVKDLFIGEQFTPEPNKDMLSLLKKTIIRQFEDKNYLQAIEYSDDYLSLEKDQTITKIRRLSLEHLA